jgi:tRNA dimethylallyltransferase
MAEQAYSQAARSRNGVQAMLIAGPTASGKSALAIRLAKKLDGVVLNMDSMQVYADLRVITARPSREEEADAPHHMFGNIDGAVNYSVGRYVIDASRALAEAAQAGRLPILVGGTGLYAKALLHGLSDMPVLPDAVRAQVRAQAEGASTPELHAWLAELDPEAAQKLRPSDRLRVMRALEVVIATGAPLSAAHAVKTPGLLQDTSVATWFLAPERSDVHAAIDRRFELMVANGALDEIRHLGSRQLDPMLPIMRAHGVPALLDHLHGGMSLQDAITRGQGDTRAYVKRQFTWFRNQLPQFHHVTPADAHDTILAAFSSCR